MGVKSARVWADPDIAEGMLRNRGVKPFGDTLISPAQAEKAGVAKSLVAEHVQKIDTAPALCKLPLRGYREYVPGGAEPGAAVQMPGVV